MTTPSGTSAVEIIRVPFQGDEILTVDHHGKPHIVLRPALESIGLDYSAQLQKIRRRSWATVGQCPTVAEDGKTREMVTVDVRTFLMLLATINEGSVSESVRPKLVTYQAEVADAIEMYWTEGGVINPRATEDQLATIIGYAERQMRVLRLADGLVDRAWLEAKTRHTVARALGEEPEVDFDKRPLTTGEYLEEKGVTGSALRSIGGTFGKKVKALYIDQYGTEPPEVDRFVGGALRSVKGYTEAHRVLFDEAWAQIVGREVAA